MAYWKPEGGTLTTSEPTFRDIELVAKKPTVLGKMSNEWAADNISGDPVSRIFAGALGWTLDKAF